MENCPKVIAITSGKGGVGKSTVAINLSLALADMGKNVILFDANLNMAGIDVSLGISPEKTLLDVIEGRCCISEALTLGPKGIRIACANTGVEELMSISSLGYYNIIKSFSDVSDELDYLIIDTAPGLHESVTTFVSAAHEILIVLNYDQNSISNAYAMIKILNRRHSKYRFKILSNMTSSHEGYEAYLKLMKLTDQFLDVSIEYIGSISYSDFFRINNTNNYAFHNDQKSKRILKEYSEISLKIDMLPLRTTPRGNIEFFTEFIVRL
jgi:flagellar biosynthesis protein FlhG